MTEQSPRGLLLRRIGNLKGDGLPQDVKRAKYWVEKASLQGYELASALLKNVEWLKEQLEEPSIETLQREATLGYSTSRFALAKAYYEGKGVAKDLQVAFNLTRQAALQGHLRAVRMLAELYEKGEGTEANLLEAYRWYSILGAKGDIEAIERWVQSAVVPPDPMEAIKQISVVADRGYPPGQFRLAQAYERGAGIPQDYPEAVLWYRKAIDGGYIPAIRHLALLFHRGGGGRRSPDEAAALYLSAACKGERDLLLNLAQLYEEGDGVPKDPERAAMLRDEVEDPIGEPIGCKEGTSPINCVNPPKFVVLEKGLEIVTNNCGERYSETLTTEEIHRQILEKRAARYPTPTLPPHLFKQYEEAVLRLKEVLGE